MRINQIIKSLRTEKNLTQEELAKQLGVTAPAVSKWEKGITFPDITLLPPLARILGTDVNNLLSFKDDLTNQEVSKFIGELAELLSKEGWKPTFTAVQDKVYEFPSSDALLFNVAVFLQGYGPMFSEEDKTEIQELVKEYLHRVEENPDSVYSDFAKKQLFLLYLNDEHYAEAEEELDLLPQNIVDAKNLRALLAYRKGDIEEAYKISENLLMRGITDALQSLGLLISIALKENKIDIADSYAAIYSQAAELFELPKLNQYTEELDIAIKIRDKNRTIQALRGAFTVFQTSWDLSKTTLYQHVKNNQTPQGIKMNELLFEKMVDGYKEDEELDFLRNEPEFVELMEEIGRRLEDKKR